MKFLLLLRHWQLFMLQVGIPIVLQVILFTVMFNSDVSTIFFKLFLILTVFSAGVFFCWLYAMAVNLHKKLPEIVVMSLIRFKIFLSIPAAYVISMCAYIFMMMSSDVATAISFFLSMMPLHWLSMICILYCLKFNAKALKAVEWQNPVLFGDYAGEFFFLLFFPIGIWNIQPRVNKIFTPPVDWDV